MAYAIVEGMDLAGKSTFIERLIQAIKDKYVVDVVRVSEPSKHNERCQEIYRRVTTEDMTVEERVQLLLEQREIVLREEVLPALGQGKFVISDRSFISNMVYQHQEGMGLHEILTRNLTLLNKLSPEATPDYGMLLEIDHKTFLERSKSRAVIDVLETPLLKVENFNKVKSDYVSAMVFADTVIKDFSWAPVSSPEKAADNLAQRYKWQTIEAVQAAAAAKEEPKGKDMSQYFVPA